MCGRFSFLTPEEELIKRFRIDEWSEPIDVRFNAAPGQRLPVIFEKDGRRHLARFSWGLVPFWAKEKKIGNRMINARAETVTQKPAFKAAFRQNRCLVPANGFFEWNKHITPHIPYFIMLKEKQPFAFAGICEHWQQGDETLDTFAIITTAANKLVARIHDRMPVILAERDEQRWLDPTLPPGEAASLLIPFPSEKMDAYPVSTLVNNPRNEGAEVIKPVK